jgi:hypothetical protein
MLLLLALAAQVRTLPEPMVSLWGSAQGQLIAFNTPTTFLAVASDRYYLGEKIGSVPDGSFLGQWVAAKRLKVAQAPPDQDGNQPLGDLSIPDPKVRADFGDILVAEYSRNAYGRTTSIKVRVLTATGSAVIDDVFMPAGSWADVNLNGTFSADRMSVQLEETTKKGPCPIRGRLTYNDTTWLLRGYRQGLGATFALNSFANNRPGAGYGYIVWAPSPSRVRQMVNRDSRTTDQVNLYLMLGDGSLPNGLETILKRK